MEPVAAVSRWREQDRRTLRAADGAHARATSAAAATRSSVEAASAERSQSSSVAPGPASASGTSRASRRRPAACASSTAGSKLETTVSAGRVVSAVWAIVAIGVSAPRKRMRQCRPRRVRSRDAGMSEATPHQERGPRRVYANDAIEVHWEPTLCIDTKSWVRTLGRVFDPHARPWVDVDAADPDAIAAAILTCPTGALLRRRDGGRRRSHPSRR